MAPLKDVYRDIYTFDGNVIEDGSNKLPTDRELKQINMSQLGDKRFI